MPPSLVFVRVFVHPVFLGCNPNGEGEIRTPGTIAGTPVFETGAFNRSATSPNNGRSGRTGGNGNTPAPRVKPTLTRDTPSRAALIGRGAWPPPHVLERALEPLLLRR